MRVTTTLKTLEKRMETGVLVFFRFLGSSEAPEDWQATAPKGPHDMSPPREARVKRPATSH